MCVVHRCTKYKGSPDACTNCRKPVHRYDVCPLPKSGLCPRCGEKHEKQENPCTPTCILCGGNHLTGTGSCKVRTPQHRRQTLPKPKPPVPTTKDIPPLVPLKVRLLTHIAALSPAEWTAPRDVWSRTADKDFGLCLTLGDRCRRSDATLRSLPLLLLFQEGRCVAPEHATSDSVVKGFGIGDSVYARSFAAGHRWKLAEVVKVKVPVSYLVRRANGEVHHRHRNQLRCTWPTEKPSEPLPDYHFRLPPVQAPVHVEPGVLSPSPTPEGPELRTGTRRPVVRFGSSV
ncbi:hypothetical protein MTO96_022959 [Rhipicephalus appendiculatus]